jgi:hypothetical protein
MSGPRHVDRNEQLEALESRLLLSAHGPAKLLAAAALAAEPPAVADPPPAITLTLDSAAISENGSVALAGKLATPASADQPVLVAWGDGQSQTVTVPAGSDAFAAAHTYLQDSSGPVVISAQIVGSDPVASASAQITVGNIAPSFSALSVAAPSATENDLVSLSGTFTDPGTQDIHTLVVDWGDGNVQTVALATGDRTFAIEHQYLDDDPTGTPSDVYDIAATITDEAGGAAAAATTVTINNAAPTIGELWLDAAIINENDTTTLTGHFTDPGQLDAHTVIINWGDGQSQSLVLATGVREFSMAHQYLDNAAKGSPQGNYTIDVTVTDDDTGQDMKAAIVTVRNVAPAIGQLTLNAPAINENDVATLSGTFTDPGTLDAHTVLIDWGDGTVQTLSLAVGERMFESSHRYLDDGPSGTAEDPYTIGVTVTDDDTGQDMKATIVTVRNVAPAIGELTLSSTVIDENGTTTLSGAFTDPGTLDSHVVLIDWGDGSSETITLNVGERTFVSTHQYLDDNPTGTGQDDYTINVTVADDDTGTDMKGAIITVRNVAPAVTDLRLSATAIDENGSTTLSGSFTDPGTLDTHTVLTDWGDGSTQTLSLAPGDRAFEATHQYLDDNPTGTPQDDYTITVTVTDDDTGADTSDTVVTVRNVAPVIASFVSSAPGVGDVREGQIVNVTGAFTDAGTLDTHTAVIDWGDGTVGPATLAQGSGSGTFSAAHAYSAGGIYTITVTLTDDDTGADTATATAVVTGVGIRAGTLYVIGSDAADKVHLNQTGKGLVHVKASFLTEDKARKRVLDFGGVQRIVVLTGDGNDSIQLAGNMAQTAVLDGGSGNDSIKAGRGSSVITGSEGDDRITGGKQGDLIVGGAGTDRIVGGPGDDLIVAGRTSFDPNDDALSAGFADRLLSILAEWGAGGANRVANISGDGPGGLNGGNYLQQGVTVFDASPADKVNGASGRNWIFDALTTKYVGKKPALPAPSPSPAVASPGNSAAAAGQAKKDVVVVQAAATPVAVAPAQPAAAPVTIPTPGNSANAPGQANRPVAVVPPAVTPPVATPVVTPPVATPVVTPTTNVSPAPAPAPAPAAPTPVVHGKGQAKKN